MSRRDKSTDSCTSVQEPPAIAARQPEPGPTDIYAIYNGYPDRSTPFVARRWTCKPGAAPVPGHLLLAPTLDQARGFVPAGYLRRPRQRRDTREILEVWVPRVEPAE